MDAFYASVEQRDHSAYRDKPVVVGADPKNGHGRGVVSAASYLARSFGIHSAMPISQAFRRCPTAVFLPVRMRRYQDVSKRIFEVFHRYTDLVESISLDEAFLDVTGSHALFGSAETIGKRIQDMIWKQERLHASVGVASNKFVAKVASDLKKPQGFVVVPNGTEREFLKKLPIGRLWGAGVKTTKVLHQAGCRTIGDIAQRPQGALRSLLGKPGAHLWQLAHGLDDRPVVPDSSAKSIGAETTFMRDTQDQEVIRRTLLRLSERVAQRLRSDGVLARSLTLKFRNELFETITRTSRFPASTDQASDLYAVALKLLSRVSPSAFKIRLLGLSATQFTVVDVNEQLVLFDSVRQRNIQRTRAMDRIRDRFGDESIQLGSLITEEKPLDGHSNQK